LVLLQQLQALLLLLQLVVLAVNVWAMVMLKCLQSPCWDTGAPEKSR
jgi:hypothetical protein